MMQTTNHPASPHDTALIAGMQSVGASGHADAGQVLAEILLGQGAAPPSPSFATLPWRADGVTGEWVAAAGTAGDAVALYLPARLSGREEPAGLTAARLSDALRLPVLQLHYRPAPDVRDALAAYKALLGQRPASRIVVPGHSVGAALVLSALAELAAAGAEVSLEVYDGLPHGFPLLPTEAALALFNRVARFTADWLRGGPGPENPRPVSIRRVSWAGYVITSEAGTSVLVDPYLSGSEGIHSGLPQSTITPAELYGCDVVAVTHAGYDHRGQAIEIVKGGRATLVSGPALAGEAVAQGVPSDRVAIMVSGVEFHCRDVTITALDARHDSTMTAGGQSVSDQPMSFVLSTAAGSRIFCGGDSSLSADMKTWGELHHPQIAVLGVGGLWVGAVKVTELPPADAAIAARWLGVQTVIPVHYSPGDPAPAQFTADLAAADSSIQVAVLDFGQSWTAAIPRKAGSRP